jgi:hypothetical protein
MLKKAQKHTKKFLSTFFHNTLVLVLSSIIGVPVLVSWFTGTLDVLVQIVKAPTPLWASISLVLLCYLYIHSIERKILEKNQNNNPLPLPIVEEKPNFTFHGNLLWLENDKSPFCPSCYEVHGKQIHVLLKQASNNCEEWNYYECHNCEFRSEYSHHPSTVPF